MSGEIDLAAVLAAEHIEREAYREVFRTVPRELAARYGVETAEVGGATCTVAAALDVGLSMFNRAIGLGVEAPVDRADFGTIVDWFAARHTDAYVQVPPTATAPGLEALLAASGFGPAYGWMKFVRGAEPAAEDESRLQVRAVGPGEAAEFARIVTTGFAMPAFVAGWLAPLVARDGWRCYVASDGDEPAGAAGLLVSEGVGWLGFGFHAFRPIAARGLSERSSRPGSATPAGSAAGFLVTETGERLAGKPAFSYSNILGSGFKQAYLRPAFVRSVP